MTYAYRASRAGSCRCSSFALSRTGRAEPKSKFGLYKEEIQGLQDGWTDRRKVGVQWVGSRRMSSDRSEGNGHVCWPLLDLFYVCTSPICIVFLRVSV